MAEASTRITKKKVAAFGSVNGNIQMLVDKMETINSSKAGPFDLFVITGDLFFKVVESDCDVSTKENGHFDTGNSDKKRPNSSDDSESSNKKQKEMDLESKEQSDILNKGLPAEENTENAISSNLVQANTQLSHEIQSSENIETPTNRNKHIEVHEKNIELAEKLLGNEFKFPVPTYYLPGASPLPINVKRLAKDTPVDLCNNLTLLGKGGIITTTAGIKIAYLSGSLDKVDSPDNDSKLERHTPSEVEKLLSSIGKKNGVDIFLSCVWPTHINKYSSKWNELVKNADIPSSSIGVAQLLARLCPQYHFSSSDPSLFFERELYYSQDICEKSNESTFKPVRFISLGSQSDQRWIYAANIAPNMPGLSKNERLDGFTPSPYSKGFSAGLHSQPAAGDIKKATAKVEVSASGFSMYGEKAPVKQCRLCSEEGHDEKNCATHPPPPKKYICHKCNIPGHWIDDCTKVSAPTSVTGIPTCYVCNEVGHHAGICPNKTQVLCSKCNRTGHQSDRCRSASKPPPESYVCKICNNPGHWIRDCPDKVEPNCRRCGEIGHKSNDCSKAPKDSLSPSDCWFCMSNPKLDKNLIVSIGEDIYSSMSKGPLVDPFGPDCLVPGGGNMLILSINHYTSFRSVPEEAREKLLLELKSYKQAVVSFYEQYNAVPVFVETHRPGAYQHAHIQVYPIPKDLISQVETAYQTAAANAGFDLNEQSVPDVNFQYLHVEIPGVKALTGIIPRRTRFDVQMGRGVASNLLGIPGRADWRECSYTETQELDMKKTFCEAFKTFDPTLQ